MSSLIFLYSTHHPIHSSLPSLPSAISKQQYPQHHHHHHHHHHPQHHRPLSSMLGSPTDSSTSSYTDSPVSQHPPVHVWPAVPRGRRPPSEPVKTPRFYSTPLDKDAPDSTPLQRYGLEEREPSIIERPKLLHRFSHALDDIKEDFSLPAERLRASRRLSTLILPDSPADASAALPPRSSPSASAASLPVPMERAPPRTMSSRSFLAVEAPARRLSRRLSSSLSFSSSKRKTFRESRGASISQPNLIGSSTQM